MPALRQVNLWSNTYRQVSFDWKAYLHQYRKVCPKRFELAVWYNGRLESLSLGRPSYKGTRLRLELIERVPSNSSLRGRVFPITEIALIAYANLLGAAEVRIMEPVNDSVRAYYVSRGYSYVPSTGAANFPDYCVRKL
jgi:hypothetical protein